MAKDTTKRRRGSTRRKSTRRAEWRALVRTRRFGWGVVIVVLFALSATALTMWARRAPLVAAGRVAQRDIVVRAPVTVSDPSATRAARDLAARLTPRVYAAERAVFDQLRNSLENLPRVILDAPTLEAMGQDAIGAFGLDAERFDGVRRALQEEGRLDAWPKQVDRLLTLLAQTPFLDGPTWTDESLSGQRGEKWLDLEGIESIQVSDSAAVNIEGSPEELRRAAESLALRAGLNGPLADVVAARLTHEPRATYRFDDAATESARQARRDAVDEVTRTIAPGSVVVRRGEILTPDRIELIRAESAAHRAAEPLWSRTLRDLGAFGAVLVVVAALLAYTVSFCPRIRKSPSRMAWVGGLLLIASAAAIAGTISQPTFAALLVASPVIFAGVIISIAYDRRTALALSMLAALLVAIALELSIARYAVIVGGLGAAVLPLGDVRDRNALIRIGLLIAAVLGGGTVLAALIDGPVTFAMLRQSGFDALGAAFGGLLVGGLTMFVLPTIERVFDITTGMTLVELRDPKQPLLRELQQRAPGTYNHSLNVASIAESAADAIGADSLLTYVGALYHDIGKMNKPEYFVENQAGGPNKHDKLRPAMSLLVIVGHVKDGVELARAEGLPKSIVHFIEAHHGTTLVEYFFRRAKQDAERETAEAPAEAPEEFDYRYPGPKPHTREVAILMLSDAVESATRSLPEPTPARIDALVRELAERRLLDGQFDECGLTLADLRTIVESISKTVSSIYHGRIAYGADQSKALSPKTRTASGGI